MPFQFVSGLGFKNWQRNSQALWMRMQIQTLKKWRMASVPTRFCSPRCHVSEVSDLRRSFVGWLKKAELETKQHRSDIRPGEIAKLLFS